ncbi:MAG: DUF3293 domain-containing protein [Gammaproteobacteria bacterium]|nr:MAG: DUF3293 domain-containing protein [Gammaproteobacteria bacterium]
MDAALVEAYRNTLFEVDGPFGCFVLRVGQASPELLRLYEVYGVDSAAHLTAFNPGSRRLSDTENRARQSQMEAQLREQGYRLFSGAGHDAAGEWPSEPAVLVLGIAREQACAVGEAFGQNAVVWCGGDTAANLILINVCKLATSGAAIELQSPEKRLLVRGLSNRSRTIAIKQTSRRSIGR